MTAAATRDALELVRALSDGAHDGGHSSTFDEAVIVEPASHLGGKPNERAPLDLEETCGPARIAERSLGAIDSVLTEWKAGFAAERMEPAALLSDLGVEPLDLLPIERQNELAEHFAERPLLFDGHQILPEYFEPLMVEAGAYEVLERLS